MKNYKFLLVLLAIALVFIMVLLAQVSFLGRRNIVLALNANQEMKRLNLRISDIAKNHVSQQKLQGEIGMLRAEKAGLETELFILKQENLSLNCQLQDYSAQIKGRLEENVAHNGNRGFLIKDGRIVSAR